MRPATMARIFTFRVLAHDHPVEIARPSVTKRRRNAWQDACRSYIRILIKSLADRQPQPPQGDMIRYIRRANSTEKDGIMHLQLLQPIFRHHFAMRLVVIRPPVICPKIEGIAAITRRQRIKNGDTGLDHFRTDTVSRDGCDIECLHSLILNPKICLRFTRDD